MFWRETSLFVGGWALTLVLLVRGWLTGLPVWLLAYVSTAVVAVRVANHVRSEADRLSATLPALRFAGVDADEVVVQNFTPAGPAMGTRPATFVRVLVSNDPGDRPGTVAENVFATITIRDAAGVPVVREMEGRWASSPQGPELTRIGIDHEGRTVELPANGAPEPLDVAMRLGTDPRCYAYNNENTRQLISTLLDEATASSTGRSSPWRSV